MYASVQLDHAESTVLDARFAGRNESQMGSVLPLEKATILVNQAGEEQTKWILIETDISTS